MSLKNGQTFSCLFFFHKVCNNRGWISENNTGLWWQLPLKACLKIQILFYLVLLLNCDENNKFPNYMNCFQGSVMPCVEALNSKPCVESVWISGFSTGFFLRQHKCHQANNNNKKQPQAIFLPLLFLSIFSCYHQWPRMQWINNWGSISCTAQSLKVKGGLFPQAYLIHVCSGLFQFFWFPWNLLIKKE